MASHHMHSWSMPFVRQLPMRSGERSSLLTRLLHEQKPSNPARDMRQRRYMRTYELALRASPPQSQGQKLGARNLRYASARRSRPTHRSEEHTSELQSLMRISYAVFCLKKKKTSNMSTHIYHTE